MDLTRRNLALAVGLGIGAASLLPATAARAAGEDAAAVKDNLEALRKALSSADKAQLEKLTAPELSYGHSSGKVQNQAEFIDGVMNRKAVIKSLTFPNTMVTVSGDAAVVRHGWASVSETDGKTTNTKLDVLAVWQKQDGNWKLLARQGFKPTGPTA